MTKAAQGFWEGLNGEASPLENCEMYMQSKKEGQRVTDRSLPSDIKLVCFLNVDPSMVNLH